MTKTSLLRPTLLPGLSRLWRDRHTLQLGLDPRRAVLLELADPRAVDLLDLLDGSRTERSVLANAARLGVAASDARTLLGSLRDAGLVVGANSLLPGALPEPVRRRLSAEAAALALRGIGAPASPAQILRRRLAARVVVTGRGRLAAPVAVALASAGVGHVVPDLQGVVRHPEPLAGLGPADVGRPNGAAVTAAIERVAPGTRTGPVGHQQRAKVVVQAGSDRPAALAAAAFSYRRQAHLLVDIREGTPTVGPFVPARGGPCLNCLDLHRRDRDPGWPALAGQLRAGGNEPCSTPTMLAAASYAAAEVLAYVDGHMPETLAAAVEISAPGRQRRRSWPPHPACGCARGSWRAAATQKRRSQ